MQILIIEDERLAVEKLKQLLKKIRPQATIIAALDSIASATDWFATHAVHPDLVLMDIELADGQSFALFEQLRIESPIIFVTSYDDYALQAFKVNSIDYLLKPIHAQELTRALDKLDRTQFFRQGEEHHKDLHRLIRQMQQYTPVNTYRQRFLVRHLQRLVPIDVRKIAYFYYEDRVTFFRTPDGKNYMVDYALDDIENMLDPHLFFRINRSVLLSLDCVQQINPYFGNRLELRLLPAYDKQVLVSRERVGDFKTWLGR